MGAFTHCLLIHLDGLIACSSIVLHSVCACIDKDVHLEVNKQLTKLVVPNGFQGLIDARAFPRELS